MCNNDGHEGPFTDDCATVASYVYDANNASPEAGSGSLTILRQCSATSGQAWDYLGGWNVILGYANCNISPDNGPSEQG